MNRYLATEDNRKSNLLTVIGMAIMVLLTLTKVVPSSNLAGFSVFVGIAFFFLAEAVSSTSGAESGLRFPSVVQDLKKPGVLVWAQLPIVSGTVSLAIGSMVFGEEYIAHLVGRTGSILTFDQILLLAAEVIIAAFGEEIAYRGFFLGKGMKIAPFWLCAIVSSLAFAAGHIAPGNAWLVFFDVSTVFIDSLVFSMVYLKSENCVVSTLSHIAGNAVSLLAVFLFF